MRTIEQALIEAKQQLTLTNYTDDSRLEAEIILAYVLGQKKEFLLTHPETTLSQKALSNYVRLVKQRTCGVPVAYLIHNREFYGLDYYVDRHVLIPRPETELMIDVAKKRCEKIRYNSLKICDIGTGSGCIAITLLKEIPDIYYMDALDVSRSALKIARYNAINLLSESQYKKIHFINTNIFLWNPSPRKYDLIVSNPPYITSSEYKHLDPQVSKYEPKLALHASDNGQEFYKRIATILPGALNKDGICLLEINSSMVNTTQALFSKWSVQIHKDFSGRPRILEIKR